MRIEGNCCQTFCGANEAFAGCRMVDPAACMPGFFPWGRWGDPAKVVAPYGGLWFAELSILQSLVAVRQVCVQPKWL
jgi:hypothetical protein